MPYAIHLITYALFKPAIAINRQHDIADYGHHV
jgi:hypothetical protein